jgi:hypothetical protein
MPGLMRGMARTAAVVGTATATRGAVNRRQADKNAKAAAQATNTYAAETQPPPQQVVYAAPPEAQYVEAAPAPEVDMIGQLERLGTLYAQGLLTDEEFAAQKAKLLAG